MALDGPSDIALAGGVTASDQFGSLGGRQLRYILAGCRAAFATGASTDADADAQLGQGGGPGSPAIGRGGEGTVGGRAEEGADVRGPKGAGATSSAAHSSWLLFIDCVYRSSIDISSRAVGQDVRAGVFPSHHEVKKLVLV